MRCKARNKNLRPWLRGLRCGLLFDHEGLHAGWFNGRTVRWADH